MRTTYIVTLFGSTNCGAYLQALAMSMTIHERYGNEVVFLDTGARNVVSRAVHQIVKSIKAAQLKRAVFWIKKLVIYKESYTALKSVRLNTVSEDSIIIFGSDEIWNVSRSVISKYPALWGDGINGGNRIAYAPSANGSRFEDSGVFESIARNLRGFVSISARDEETALEIEKVIGDKVDIVCDPTLLLNERDYRNFEGKTTIENDSGYILVYSYGKNIPSDRIEEIVKLADRHNLRLISADNLLSWCDESKPCGPFGFLRLIRHAKYVITDTFHGTVFSVIYKKQFISFASNNEKIIDFLNRIGLDERIPISDTAIEDCLNRDIEWDRTMKELHEIRSRSFEFLNEAMTKTLK